MKNELKEKKGKVKQVVNQVTIKKFLHAQFIKIGVVIGILMTALGIFAIYEGVQLAKFKSQNFKTSVGTQTTLTIVLISAAVVAGILLVDKLLNIIALKTIKRISEPVTIMDEAMGKLANGNLENQIVYDRNDEFTNMMTNTKNAMLELKKYIGNISDTLQQMSEKNMNVGIEEEYIGDFAEIRTSLLNIADSLNITISEMRTSFTQVRDGADSLAETAQAMADGAEQQSKHIRGLLEEIEKISSSVHENTVAAEGVEKLSQSSMIQMEEGEKKMKELTTAMDLIRKGSNEIASIIEVITEIAAQTNLLALNASIEAARAGEHGKGFAVVAGEIGTLASSSAEASHNITELIQKSISAVNNGVEVTSETAEILAEISRTSSDISKNITTITDSSRNQDVYLKNVVDSANEIAAVTDQNTAAAEESSALSEQLLGYTDNVMTMIEQYNIRDN